MCGIMGAISNRDTVPILLEGLQNLEYRGYDSSGLAIIDRNTRLQRLRRVGKVSALLEAIKNYQISGNIGIAHTRWATHGKATKNNSHPHISDNIVVVHNGIIDNYELIKSQLIKNGYIFISDTDTEVIAHLIHWEQERKRVSLLDAIKKTVDLLHGSYSIVVMDSQDPNSLFGVCNGSPLLIGVGVKENFFSSDQLAFSPLTQYFIPLENGDITKITRNSIHIWDKFSKVVNRKKKETKIGNSIRMKGSYQFYMQKEIFEQPKVIRKTIENRLIEEKIFLSELEENRFSNILEQMKNIQIVACGTSYHSALIAKYWFETISNIPCDVEIASEFRYRNSILREKSLLVILSQSGETADTLASLRLGKHLGYLGILSICNIFDSSITRESDIVIMTRAGIEISVASTKSFTTQLTVLLMLAVKISRVRSLNLEIERDIIYALKVLPDRIRSVLGFEKCIISLAKKLFDKNHMFFLGRGIFYPIAMEGALKIKEIAYIHAEAYASGEIKHGPLALIDDSIPVIFIAPKNRLLEKLKSNIEEVYARGGKIYILTDEKSNFYGRKNMEIIYLPNIEEVTAPIFYTIPLQLLAYHISVIKGIDVDHPRNLAKSVTVE